MRAKQRVLAVVLAVLSEFIIHNSAFPQQPTTTASLFSGNSQYLQGRTWADYKASAGAALTLNVAAGTSWCNGALVTYAGGTLAMTDDATNYVYLDAMAACVPAKSVAAFPASAIPLATVVTASGAISTVTDNRTLLLYGYSSGGLYDVTMYGAACDGVTDDTTEFNAALTAIGTAGGVLYVPPSATKCVLDADSIVQPPGHKQITWLLDGGLSLTSKASFVDTNTSIIGRAGAAHTWGGSKEGADIECDLDAATTCFEILTPDEYAITFENVNISGTALHFLDVTRSTGLHLINVNTVEFAEEAVILRHSLWTWITGGTLFGPAGSALGALGLYPATWAGPTAGIPQILEVDGTIFNTRGVHLISTGGLDGMIGSQLRFKNIAYEGGKDEFFVAGGDKTAYVSGVEFDDIMMADPVTPAALISVTGSVSMRDVHVRNSLISETTQIVAAGSNAIAGLHVEGLGEFSDYQSIAPGPTTNDLSYTWFAGYQNAIGKLVLGKFYNSTDLYDGPILRIEPTANNMEAAVIRSFEGAAWPDVFRIEDMNGGFNLARLGQGGRWDGFEVGGSLRLYAYDTITASAVTPTGDDDGVTRAYKIVALDRSGEHNIASNEVSNAHGATALDADNYNTITWNCLTGATRYQIWMTNAGGGTPANTGLVDTIPASIDQSRATNVCYYAHIGADGNSATAPATNTTGKLTAPIFNAGTGFRIADAAASGNYLKGDGTNFVVSTGDASGVGSCTNQFVTAANSDAAPTCTTATLASAQFANQGTTTTMLHGNAGGNPSWAGISLANDTAANQGTTTTVLHGNAAGQPSFAGVSLTADATVNQGTTTTLLHGNAAGAPSWGGVSLANDTAANQGTVTTVLHGNAAGQPSFSAVVVADVTAVLKTRQFGYIAGADAATAVLADTDDQATVYANRLGQGITITEVFCECDGGTPRIQLQRDDGAPANILTDNAGAGMDCAAAGATGTIDGNEDNVADGEKIDFVMVTAGGVAKRVTVYVKYTLD